MTDESTNTSTEASAQAPGNTDSDIAAVLHYDPFAGKSENEIPAAKAPAKAAENTDGTSTAVSAENKAPATGGGDSSASAAQKPVTPVKSDVDAYRDIANHLAAIASTTAKPAAEPETPKDNKPNYQFNIPDELVKVLTTNDPVGFKQGLAAFASGIANSVHASMLEAVQSMYNPRFETIPQMMLKAIEVQSKVKEVDKDFYGTYPELNNEHLRPLIEKVGGNVAKRLGKKAWDAELRDEIAKETKAIIQAATGQAPAAARAPVRAPAKMLSNQGARPSAAQADAETADIMATLFDN